MSEPYPHELQFGEIYVTPVIVVFFAAFIAAFITAAILNKTGLARWFVMPRYVFLAFFVLYGILIDTFFIRF